MALAVGSRVEAGKEEEEDDEGIASADVTAIFLGERKSQAVNVGVLGSETAAISDDRAGPSGRIRDGWGA